MENLFSWSTKASEIFRISEIYNEYVWKCLTWEINDISWFRQEVMNEQFKNIDAESLETQVKSFEWLLSKILIK